MIFCQAVADVTAADVMFASDCEARIGGQRSRCGMSRGLDYGLSWHQN